MKVYEVTDGDEIEQFFATKAAAIRYAKQTDRDRYELACEDAARWGSKKPVREHDFSCTVTEIITPPLSHTLLVQVLNGGGYALIQRRVWPPEGEE